MLPCKTPTTLKKGDILFSFEGITFDDDTSTVENHEWHVRSIQTKPTVINLSGNALLNHSRKATFVNLVSKKKGTTWVKGKWAKYIAKDYQIKFELKNRLPHGIYTTKLQAIKFAVKDQHAHIASAKSELQAATSKKEIDSWSICILDLERELVRLKSKLTKITRLNNKTKATK
jgi:hypothetical protein